MKIAIISDSHDNIANVYKALDFIKKNGVEMIIHCGDVCAPSVLAEFAKKFAGVINLVYGNIDGDRKAMKKVASQNSNVKIHGNTGEVEIDSKKIAFTHFPADGKKLAESGKYNYVFYGHNHKPWIEKVNDTYLINPGTLAGLFAKATFALWETKEVEPKLILLEQI